jgi:hypothetical protein
LVPFFISIFFSESPSVHLCRSLPSIELKKSLQKKKIFPKKKKFLPFSLTIRDNFFARPDLLGCK